MQDQGKDLGSVTKQNFICTCYIQGKLVTPPHDMLLQIQALPTVQNGFLGRGLAGTKSNISQPTEVSFIITAHAQVCWESKTEEGGAEVFCTAGKVHFRKILAQMYLHTQLLCQLISEVMKYQDYNKLSHKLNVTTLKSTLLNLAKQSDFSLQKRLLTLDLYFIQSVN